MKRLPKLYLKDGLGHCKTNGGSYWIHARNGLIKSFYGLGIFITGTIHSLVPWLLPYVAESLVRDLVKKVNRDIKSYKQEDTI